MPPVSLLTHAYMSLLLLVLALLRSVTRAADLHWQYYDIMVFISAWIHSYRRLFHDSSQDIVASEVRMIELPSSMPCTC